MPDFKLEALMLFVSICIFYLCVWTVLFINGCFYMYNKGRVTGLERTQAYRKWTEKHGTYKKEDKENTSMSFVLSNNLDKYMVVLLGCGFYSWY